MHYIVKRGQMFLILLLLNVGSGIFDVEATCVRAPDSCPNENITFWLYNEYIEEPYQISELESSIEKAPFKQGTRLVILIHGYTGHRDFSPNIEIRPALLNYTDYNVISVDYGAVVKAPCYIEASFNVVVVGKCLAKFLRQLFILRPDVVSPEDTHVIGFSLGAHVAGICGSTFFQLTSSFLPRITGLDPALPLFDSVSSTPSLRLDATDAEFVDVIHTNAGITGKILNIGHVDFYINNGHKQPGCKKDIFNITELYIRCSHKRSVEIYAEAIGNPNGFWGVRCILGGVVLPREETKLDLALLGPLCPNSTRGTYVVYTNKQKPYAQGKPDDPKEMMMPKGIDSLFLCPAVNDRKRLSIFQKVLQKIVTLMSRTVGEDSAE